MSAAFDSPLSYEREAFQSRRRLSSALDELTNSLTPGRMLDEVLTFGKGGGANFLKGMGNSAATNPIPTLLIGAALVMFLSGKGRVDTLTQAMPGSGAGPGVGDQLAAAFDTVTSGIRKVVQDVEAGVKTAGSSTAAAASSVGKQAASALGAVADTASSAASGAADMALSVADQVASGAGAAQDAINSGTATVRETGSGAIDSISSRMATLAKEQPLIVAAAGLVMGAAFAALLPKSQAEDQLFGEASDHVKEAVGDIATEQYQQAADVVSNVVDQAKNAAADQGISPSLAAEGVRDLTKKVTRVMSATSEAATDAVRDRLGTSQQSSSQRVDEMETTP